MTLARVRHCGMLLPMPFSAAMSDRDEKLARARCYPYCRPGASYIWRDGEELPEARPLHPAHTNGRTPVLAVGSNRSPRQLARKYGGNGRHSIPVQRALLRDFDVVYAAHISAYGAVPAMLQAVPGVAVSLFVTWLDDRQLEIMHATEGGYHFAAIEGVDLSLEGGGALDTVYLYVGKIGHLSHEGAPVSLRSVEADGRANGTRETAEVLQLVHDRIGDPMPHDEFVLRLAEDTSFRRCCIECIAEDAVPFAYPFRVIDF
jgi:hypothetical protein